MQKIRFSAAIFLLGTLMAEVTEGASVGVRVQEVTTEIAGSVGLDKPRGTLVVDVSKGGPADRAGVKAGDIIVAYDGKVIERYADLPPLVAGTTAGTKIKIRVFREQRELDIFVTVSEQGETQPISEVRFSSPSEVDVCGVMFGRFFGGVSVYGEVSRGINLADHSVAKKILNDGLSWAQERCGARGLDQGVHVTLYWQGTKIGAVVVSGNVGRTGIGNYRNFPVEEVEKKEKQRQQEEKQRQQEEKQRQQEEEHRRQEQERQLRAQEEARRRAEERDRWEAQQRAEQARLAKEKADREAARQRRWNDLVRKYGIQEMIDADALRVNPFAYQGKTVAIHTHFERMVSPDAGLFANGNIMVSGLPRDLFRARSIVVLVGRVTGTTGQVPQLKFVGVHFCKDYSCGDILK
jgi:pyruvate/2-oxoglutarate dehydrogenase complex dihydrolipoamide acyltransferase (E2) component